ncbi:MAG: hypothetical protein ABI120_01470 [Gemmatimonadaceae bacterium]
MTNRRYSDEEVAAIFAKAIEAEGPALTQPSRDVGLSLTDLQNIGRDVGLTPEAVANAARSMDTGAPASARTFLGFPVAVERTVMLNRRLSDEEWELLVVKLRDAFDAKGRVSASGSLRQWTNGNLQALLEPTSAGHRLRLRTFKASAHVGMRFGMFAMAMSGAVALSGAVGGHFAGSLPGVALLFTVGAGMFASGVLPLRQWAHTRRQQMERIADDLGRA